MLNKQIVTVNGGIFESFRVFLDTAKSKTILLLLKFFYRNFAKKHSFIGSGKSLKINKSVFPSSCSYRSARADCFAFEKLTLLIGGLGPTRECAKSDEGPYCAITKRSVLYYTAF